MVKQRLKKMIFFFLSIFGVLRYWRFKNRHAVTALMIHGVMEKHEQVSWQPLRSQLPPDEFKRVLKLLANYYQFITVDQCTDMLAGKIEPINNALLITFDDGYRNNIDYALPICEQFGIKPVLFVATGHIDSRKPFWFDRLDYALQQNMGGIIPLTQQGKEYHFDATSSNSLKHSYKKFRDECKLAFTDDIEMNQLFDALSEKLELRSGKALDDICVDDDWSAMVSWEQLHEAVTMGRLDIASHTVDHLRLDSLSEQQILWQLQQSKERIEEKLASKCNYFCYPNGNYKKLAIDLVKKSGYRAAFSTDVGLCKSKDDLMTLKRFNFPMNKTESEIIYLLNH